MTDDERRRVAERLRKLAESVLPPWVWYTDNSGREAKRPYDG